MSAETENLKRRLSVGPEYRKDKTPDGIEIWPTLTRAEIAEIMGEAAVRIEVLETEVQCDEEYMDSMHSTIAELRGALREFSCPRPCNGRPDDFTVGQCLDAGECGCIKSELHERVKADV